MASMLLWQDMILADLSLVEVDTSKKCIKKGLHV